MKVIRTQLESLWVSSCSNHLFNSRIFYKEKMTRLLLHSARASHQAKMRNAANDPLDVLPVLKWHSSENKNLGLPFHCSCFPWWPWIRSSGMFPAAEQNPWWFPETQTRRCWRWPRDPCSALSLDNTPPGKTKFSMSIYGCIQVHRGTNVPSTHGSKHSRNCTQTGLQNVEVIETNWNNPAVCLSTWQLRSPVNKQ